MPSESEPGAWLECSVRAEAEAVDAVAEVFDRWGEGTVVEEPILVGDDPETYTIDRSQLYLVKTYLPDDERAPQRQQRIVEAIWHLGRLRRIEPPVVRRLKEDWANAWKAFFPVLHVGQHLVIVPSWLQHQPAPDEVVIDLDPGMAFGTGVHPTTRMCLALLERHLRPGDRVLDVGTGSGILAIAAGRLGAGAVVALDIEPQAVETARANLARNGVAATVQLGTLDGRLLEPIARGALPPFDLVLANISAQVVIALAPALAAALRLGGLAICSGLLEPREVEVAGALGAAEFELTGRQAEDDWVALVARKRGAAG